MLIFHLLLEERPNFLYIDDINYCNTALSSSYVSAQNWEESEGGSEFTAARSLRFVT